METATLDYPKTHNSVSGNKHSNTNNVRVGYMTVENFDKKFRVELDNLCRKYGILK